MDEHIVINSIFTRDARDASVALAGYLLAVVLGEKLVEKGLLERAEINEVYQAAIGALGNIAAGDSVSGNQRKAETLEAAAALIESLKRA